MHPNNKRTFLFCVLVFAAQYVFAGTETHGGGGFLCDNHVVLIDLFEAGVPGELSPKGLHISRSDKPSSEQIAKALHRIERVFSVQLRSEVARQIELAMKIRAPVPAGAELSVPTDVDGELSPKGCRMVGVASYNDQKQRLLIDDKYYAALGETDKAALWIHEGLYKFLRENHGATDSRLARKMVGFLFSDISDSDIKSAFPSNLPFAGPATQGKRETFLVETKAEICPVFFVTAAGNCEMLLKVESNGARAVNASEVLDGKDLNRVEILASDQFNFTVRGNSLSNSAHCRPSVTYLDQFLRPVGKAPFYVDKDLLATEKLFSPAVMRPSNFDYF